MRSIKKLAAMMVLAMTMTICLSAQTPVAAKGIIILDRSNAVQTSDGGAPKTDENADATGSIITTTLTSISILISSFV
jgi:hypothetical protein